MDSVWTAVKSISRKLCAVCANRLRRWSLKMLRNAIWRADEWCHEQEVRLREEAARPAFQAEVNRVQSAKREHALKKLPACPPLDATAPAVAGKTTGARRRLSAASMAPRRQFPKLKYQHGEFVSRERG
jgi:hypothetical protein